MSAFAGNRTLVDAGRSAQQDHSVLCVELGQWPIRRCFRWDMA